MSPMLYSAPTFEADYFFLFFFLLFFSVTSHGLRRIERGNLLLRLLLIFNTLVVNVVVIPLGALVFVWCYWLASWSIWFQFVLHTAYLALSKPLKLHGNISFRNYRVSLFHKGLEPLLDVLFIGDNWFINTLLNMLVGGSCWYLCSICSRCNLKYCISSKCYHYFSASFYFSTSSQYWCLYMASRLSSLIHCSIRAESLVTSLL
jgi:hypothetical protein